jgi:hypothetical protein
MLRTLAKRTIGAARLGSARHIRTLAKRTIGAACVGSARHIRRAARESFTNGMRVAARIIQERTMRMRVGLPIPSDAPSHVGNFSDSIEARLLRNSYCEVIANPSQLPECIQTMEGFSGRKYRALINLVVSRLPKARYLEVGSWKGSTVCAALHGNTAQGVCIDNWSEFGGPRDEFMTNTANITSRLRVIEGDFRSVDYASLGKFNVYLFDGPHAEEDQRDGIVCALPALAERFLLVVDDWNWLDVRLGTMRGLISSQLKIEAAIEIRTAMDNLHPGIYGNPGIWGPQSDWHNGYILAILNRS